MANVFPMFHIIPPAFGILINIFLSTIPIITLSILYWLYLLASFNLSNTNPFLLRTLITFSGVSDGSLGMGLYSQSVFESFFFCWYLLTMFF